MSQIVILHPVPSHNEDWQTPFAQYKKLLGEKVVAHCWESYAPSIGHDLVLPLLAWGYHNSPAWWFHLLVELEDKGATLANSIDVLRWNSDKSYLIDLHARGIDIVPTMVRAQLGDNDLKIARNRFGAETLIAKPLISGGADRTFRLAGTQTIPKELCGKAALVQPFLPSVNEEGEYSLVYFDGAFSHAVLKRPAKNDFRVQDQFGGTEQVVTPTPDLKAIAQSVLDATNAIFEQTSLTYARVDLVRGLDGKMQLMELELIEPALFLHHAPDQGQAFAKAVHARMASPHLKTTKIEAMSVAASRPHAHVGDL